MIYLLLHRKILFVNLIQKSYQDKHNKVFRAYADQLVNGEAIENSGTSVALDQFGNVISFGIYWANVTKSDRDRVRNQRKIMTASQAVLAFAKFVKKPLLLSQLRETQSKNSQVEVIGAKSLSSSPIICKLTLFKTANSLDRVWSVRIRTARNS